MIRRVAVLVLAVVSAGFAPVEVSTPGRGSNPQRPETGIHRPLPEAGINLPLPGNLVEVPVAAPGEVFIAPKIVHIPEDKQGDMVKLGRKIFTDTINHARRFTGNEMACSSCHLSEGRKPDAAPMWAAWVRYPRLGANGTVTTFESQVQDCFHFEMNGQSPPLDSPEMQALVAYAQWLASDAPTRGELRGQSFGAREALAGAPDAVIAQAGSAQRGERLYRDQCMLCHGSDGEGVRKASGGYQFPPVWGKQSFTGGSGFARSATLAAFIQHNMPLARGGSLDAQASADLAAYLLAQPRRGDPRQGLIHRGLVNQGLVSHNTSKAQQ